MNAAAKVMCTGHDEERVDIATMLDWLTRDARAEHADESLAVKISHKVGIVVVVLLFLLCVASMRG